MIETENIKPIIRWAGGKNWLTKSIDDYLPTNFYNYYEPFLGGGAIYFHLKSHKRISGNSYLSDINSNLINTYKQVKSNLELLLEDLTKHKNNKEYYYNIRSIEFSDAIEKASKFLYLNRTSFNGIYRENLKGKYNVPYGFKTYKQLFDIENLAKASKLLKGTYLSVNEFKTRLNKPIEGDLVFIDPPYTVAHSHNGFVKYNQKIFRWEDQEALHRTIDTLTERGVFVILTNAFHESISKLYSKSLNQTEISRTSQVGGKGAQRGEVKEYIFTNF
jgi:DNA adenine methylase